MREPAGLGALRSAIANHLARRAGHRRRSWPDRDRQRHPGGHQPRRAAVRHTRITRRRRGPLLPGRRVGFRGSGRRDRQRPGRRRRAYARPPSAACRVAALRDAIAPVSDRRHAVGRPSPRHHRVGAATAATSSKTTTTATSATRARRCAPWPPLAPDCVIYLGTFSKSLGAGLRIGYMVVPQQLAEACADDEGAPQQRQRLAGAGDDGGVPAERQLRRPSARASAPATARAATATLRRSAAISARSCQRRDRRLAPSLAPAAGRSGRGPFSRRWRCASESASIRPRLGRRPCPPQTALSRRSIVLGYAALTPRQIEKGIARLSNAIDDAHRRSRNRHGRLVSAQTIDRAVGRPSASWTHDFGSGRLYAARHRPRAGSRHIARQGGTPMPGQKHLSLPGEGIERPAPVSVACWPAGPSRRIASWRSRAPAHLRHETAAMGEEGHVRDADARGGPRHGRDPRSRVDSGLMHHAGQPPPARGRSRTAWRSVPRSRPSFTAWSRPCARAAAAPLDDWPLHGQAGQRHLAHQSRHRAQP